MFWSWYLPIFPFPYQQMMSWSGTISSNQSGFNHSYQGFSEIGKLSICFIEFISINQFIKRPGFNIVSQRLARRRNGQCLSMRAWLFCPACQSLMVRQILIIWKGPRSIAWSFLHTSLRDTAVRWGLFILIWEFNVWTFLMMFPKMIYLFVPIYNFAFKKIVPNY